MRNWNTSAIRNRRRGLVQFSSYLWGIETISFSQNSKHTGFRFHLTYEELKQKIWTYILPIFSVFILPMRNWNSSTLSSRNFSMSVFILPMRNWNIFSRSSILLMMYVFILPMRNWNHSTLGQSRCPETVFILPMRNWNKGNKFQIFDLQAFSSYLWGIETSCHGCCFSFCFWVFILPMRNWNLRKVRSGTHKLAFSSYLWGIETSKLFQCFITLSCPFSSYLWGIETRSYRFGRANHK